MRKIPIHNLVLAVLATGVAGMAGLSSVAQADNNAGASPRSSQADGIWRPAVGTRWWWQIENTAATDITIDADVFDVDLFDGAQSGKINELREAGKRVICYFSAGTYEPYRSDAGDFTADALIPGANLTYFQEETWLNIGNTSALENTIKPIMLARLDLAQSQGCDAVEPDNVDGYANPESNGRISAAQQLAYNRWLASAAHARGMSIGLKNNVEQVPDLVADFDFAVNEQCFAFSNECVAYESTFLLAGKAVFNQEYGSTAGGGGTTENEYATEACPYFRSRNISSLWKPRLNVNGRNVTVCELDVATVDVPEDREETDSAAQTLPALTLPRSQWVQVSLPASPAGADTVAAIFDELGADNYGRTWVVYHLDETTDPAAYVQLTPDSPMRQGDGYWVLQKERASVDVRMPEASVETALAGSSACASAQGCFEVGLQHEAGQQRWNLVGYPLADPASLSGSRIVTDGGSCRTGCTVDQAQADGIIRGTLYHYDGDSASYTTVTGSEPLRPWQGVWIATLGGGVGTETAWLVAPE